MLFFRMIYFIMFTKKAQGFMMRKSFWMLVSVFCLTISSYVYHSSFDSNAYDLIKKEATTSETTITVLEFSSFLIEKKEHYPLSDEFIERFQQEKGGYIDFAKQTGHLVDKQKHEPNQKWHFFESWLLQSFKDGTITWEDDAKSRIYSKLLCPELLLWIYEASGVNPSKVKNAKDVAEQGRINNLNVSTIAKNMRSCVLWEDCIAWKQ